MKYWIRLGTSSTYNKLDTLDAIANSLVEIGIKFPIEWTLLGIIGNGNNYSSVFCGDTDYERELNTDERHYITERIKLLTTKDPLGVCPMCQHSGIKVNWLLNRTFRNDGLSPKDHAEYTLTPILNHHKHTGKPCAGSGHEALRTYS